MNKFFLFISQTLLTLTSSCKNDPPCQNNSYELKQYLIVSYGGHNVRINNGTSADDEIVKDENGNELKFKSLTGVINYMISKGWQLEEVVAQPQYRLASQDANLIFSRPTTMPKLKKLLNESYQDN